ncbi:hypothetical protein PCANB_003020 [Pneumocystis canis]|nr:hypothetical protein PCANB_003020 [Pneumocystis canis]
MNIILVSKRIKYPHFIQSSFFKVHNSQYLKNSIKQLNYIKINPNHGLWDFFRDSEDFPSKKEVLSTPQNDMKYGRAWMASELRTKSFEDLHRLWYLCLKERNIIATQRQERQRLRIFTGAEEASKRDHQVRLTMARLKFVLNERLRAWNEAKKLEEENISISNESKLISENTSQFSSIQPNSSLINSQTSNLTSFIPSRPSSITKA